MGKVTLYHPISLHVIRGAAEYCGFKFSHIKQLYSEPDRQRARYNAQIVGFPSGWTNQPLPMMQNDLRRCFMDDIEVHWLRQNKSDQWCVHIQVDLSKSVAEYDVDES